MIVMIDDKCKSCRNYSMDAFGDLACLSGKTMPVVGYACYRKKLIDKSPEVKEIKRSMGVDEAENKLNGDRYKADGGKIRLDLVEPSLIEAVGRIRTYGVAKYPDEYGYRKLDKKRIIAAAMRHFEAYRRGEKNDAESGMPHLWHAACNMMFLIEMEGVK